MIKPLSRTAYFAVFAAFFFAGAPVKGSGSYSPDPTQTFSDAIQTLPLLRNYSFGTGSGRNVTNLSDLAQSFTPYGIAGTTVTNQQWGLYQPFKSENFVFTASSLNLTATIPAGGGLYPGGIHTGQIWSKQTFKPGSTYSVYQPRSASKFQVVPVCGAQFGFTLL